MKKNHFLEQNNSELYKEVDNKLLSEESNGKEIALHTNSKQYVVPTILPSPLHPAKEELKEALDTPYKAMDASDKLSIISALPWMNRQVPSNLSDLFYRQNRDLSDTEKDFVRDAKQLRRQMSELACTTAEEFLKEQEVSDALTSDDKYLKSLAEFDFFNSSKKDSKIENSSFDMDDIEEEEEQQGITSYQKIIEQNLQKIDSVFREENEENIFFKAQLKEIDEEGHKESEYINSLNSNENEINIEENTSNYSKIKNTEKDENTSLSTSLVEEFALEQEAIKGHKILQLDEEKNSSFFVALFTNLFYFGKKTLNEDIGILHGREKSRLLFTELSFLLVIIFLFLFYTVSSYLFSAFKSYALQETLQFIVPQILLNIFILGFPFILLSQTQSLKYDRIFGKSTAPISHFVVLFLLSFPLGIFLKSFNNIIFYFFSWLNFHIELLTFPSFRSFLVNQNQWENIFLAYLFGLLLPILMQGLFFRGLMQGHMMARGYRWSAIIIPSLANALFEMQPDYIISTFLFAIFASYVRLQTNSLNFSILTHAVSFFIYHRTNDLLELLRINTDWVDSLTGLYILKQSVVALALTFVLIFLVYRYFSSVRRQYVLFQGGRISRTQALPFSFLFLLASALAFFLKMYLYF